MNSIASQAPKPETVYLKDYLPPTHWIDSVFLRVDLHEDRAIVTSVLKIRRNLDRVPTTSDLRLNGEELKLKRIVLDGKNIPASGYVLDAESLYLKDLPESFCLEIETECEPQNNLAFEGLYRSAGMFCTQCEAEGFRRITYFLDRPDVMSVYRVEIEADLLKYPILLSNGNPVQRKKVGKERHLVVWEDPFKKPCYLFAMVAGQLSVLESDFKCKSGKIVRILIYTNPGLESRCHHAMHSLKLAMKWDEDVFGLEYDLDIFMIVAVNDFNMGAMENKGLNIFNAHYVLAQPNTATDHDYDGIMSVVGHEYFHNWTGNRVTCRDWFQLSLKEGLTVFRDQQFSADMTSASVHRILDVLRLRTLQFAEDSGPMAHPIRPQAYMTINNFYTATVYEKGAEVIRMIHTVIGEKAFRLAMDQYFTWYDGKAVTTEDFLKAMQSATQRDLSQFQNWYDQSGTPIVHLELKALENNRFELIAKQSCPPTPGQSKKNPFYIPIAFAMLDSRGKDQLIEFEDDSETAAATTRLLHLQKTEQSFRFKVQDAKTVPSFLRGFSAPIHLEYKWQDSELAFLIKHDSDPFAKWEAAQRLATGEIKRLVAENTVRQSIKHVLIDSFSSLLHKIEDPAFTSLMLHLPDEPFLAQLFAVVDPNAIHTARENLRLAIAEANELTMLEIYQKLHLTSRNGLGKLEKGQRSLKNKMLEFLCTLPKEEYLQLAHTQMSQAELMTDELGALSALLRRKSDWRDRALKEFHSKWKNETLVMNKWLSLQATSPAQDALEKIKRIRDSNDFDITNPNKIYSLFGHFATMNPVRFHSDTGDSYKFLADQIIDIESRNPQMAARLMGAFNSWRRFDERRQMLMQSEIQRILKKPNISKDIFEIATKSLLPRDP